ncbi:oligosaccharide flippase family protein [Edaphobacter bradus]|uniref:oligosaccharide flippase family protein n=1 Tax=Edaphobacter bradus TaxID=2259016 RepID=UPI0021E07C90|nr:oligosaccharide flippase family protein [Edaphobacter bradus]
MLAGLSSSDRRPSSDSVGVARDQIRGSSLFMVGNVFSLAITFLPHLVLVRYLTTEAFGHWAYALSLVTVGKTYALGFNEAMSRFVPIYHAKQESSKALGSIVVVFAVTLLISCSLITIFAVASHPILEILTKGREPVGLLLILMILIPLETTDLLIMNLFACFARTREVFWGRYILPPVLRATVIALTVFRHEGLSFLAYGYLLVEFLTIVSFGALLVRELRRQKMLQHLKCVRFPVREIFGFSVPLMGSNVIGMIGGSIPVLLLGYFHPISTVAYYRVVLPAAGLSGMIPGNFMPLYMPSASRLFAKGDTRGINHLFWETSLWMSALAFPIFLITCCSARTLTSFLYGARYAPSASILAILSLGYFSNVIFAFSGVTLKVLGKVRLMVILNIVTPIIIVVLNLLFIPRYGAIGAAVATASGLIVQNILRQLGLWLGGEGISFFEKRYASFFLVLAASFLGLYFIQLFTPNNIYVALSLALAVSGVVLCLIKKQLNVADTFPEILRLPIVGKLFA